MGWYWYLLSPAWDILDAITSQSYRLLESSLSSQAPAQVWGLILRRLDNKLDILVSGVVPIAAELSANYGSLVTGFVGSFGNFAGFASTKLMMFLLEGKNQGQSRWEIYL
jgi:hypothetical protein